MNKDTKSLHLKYYTCWTLNISYLTNQSNPMVPKNTHHVMISMRTKSGLLPMVATQSQLINMHERLPCVKMLLWDSLGTTSIQWKGVVLSTDILNSVHFQTGQLNWPIYTTNHLFAHQQIYYSCILHSTRTISSTCWAAWMVNPPVTAELIAANVKQTWLLPHYQLWSSD